CRRWPAATRAGSSASTRTRSRAGRRSRSSASSTPWRPGMAVMVTGALGALGSAVVRRLVAEGEKTIAFDARDETGLIGDLLDDVQVEVGDIRDWTRLARVGASSGVEGLIHMSALLPREAQRNPRRAVEVNVNATCDICELARVFGLRRVVFSSSKGVYK